MYVWVQVCTCAHMCECSGRFVLHRSLVYVRICACGCLYAHVLILVEEKRSEVICMEKKEKMLKKKEDFHDVEVADPD